MNIHLIVPSYNNPASTKACVESALMQGEWKTGNLTAHLFNHWEKDAGAKACAETQARFPLSLRLYNYRQNRGLARSWNEGIHAAFGEGADVVVIANADIRFGPGSLKQLVECARDNAHQRGITFCSGHHGKHGPNHSFGHSLFVLTPLCIQTIGYFDQNIKKAYYEDSDYDRRRDRAGVWSADAGLLDVYHEGSESIFLADPKEEAEIRKWQDYNADYYYKKWGANEEYPCPFNMDVPPWLPGVEYHTSDHNRKLQYISWERRESPYPGFNRPDPEPVRL